eukprot:CAMPEP_0195059876 /NCGR_PEP_ID=MMETSP0448-20130528/7265_1 /TAXON_ID=66468 /ORGANISM="Heterocapsa triquestra, Strain CCMP 448" /LENGTH=391 /DNA_ID=CAMNT_0040090217 /DNA_START=109 /DNA_END=1284 /DNA_ORIENTATION=+
MTPEEEAANYQRRAQEIRDKAAFQEVVDILEEFPKAASLALSHLNGLGYDIAKDADEGPKSTHAKATESRALARKNATAVSHATVPDEARDLPAEALGNPKVEATEDLNVTAISKELLQHIEPGPLSTSNLRSMSLRSGIDSTKSKYMRLVEFTTGMEKGCQIIGPLLVCVWQNLIDAANLNNKWRGRRARDCKLPIKLAEHSVYTTHVDEGGRLYIVIRSTGASKQAPVNMCPQNFCAADTHVEFNWGESHAKLCFQPGMQGPPFNIVELVPDSDGHILQCFREEYISTKIGPASGLPTRAIEDKAATPTKERDMLESSQHALASSPVAAACENPGPPEALGVAQTAPGEEANGAASELVEVGPAVGAENPENIVVDEASAEVPSPAELS